MLIKKLLGNFLYLSKNQSFKFVVNLSLFELNCNTVCNNLLREKYRFSKLNQTAVCYVSILLLTLFPQLFKKLPLASDLAST